MYQGCWVLVLSLVMSPFDVLLLLSVTYQTGHSVVRLPGDAQTGAAGPAPPQPSACSQPFALGSPHPAPLMLPPSTRSLRSVPAPGC